MEKNLSEKHKTHQGYGDEGLYFLTYHLPQITNFPNFEKFHSLEDLIYIIFLMKKMHADIYFLVLVIILKN